MAKRDTIIPDTIIQHSQFIIQRSSGARDRQALDQQRGRGDRAAELEVRAYHSDVMDHFRQIPRNGYLFDGKGQLAVFNPHTARPARVVAGHDVDSEADKLESTS